jgi:hypothetical protein
MQYFDVDGKPTGIGRRVRKITITISGSGLCKDPMSGRAFGVQLERTIRILS